MDVDLGANPNYTWRIIWLPKVMVKDGIRWRVGNGKRIRVVSDP